MLCNTKLIPTNDTPLRTFDRTYQPGGRDISELVAMLGSRNNVGSFIVRRNSIAIHERLHQSGQAASLFRAAMAKQPDLLFKTLFIGTECAASPCPRSAAHHGQEIH